MPRLKFDLQPLSREDTKYQTREEHDAWVRRCWVNWERAGQPRPCDCGYWSDGWLVTCDDGERKRCRASVAMRLEQAYRREHLEGLKKKRVFPPLERCSYGTCYWCRLPIVHGKRPKSRAMHDGREDEPNCRLQYDLRTRLEVQQSYLLDRDGKGCAECGAMRGRWGAIWTDATDDRVAATWKARAWIRERFGERPAGPLTYIGWATKLEVDHHIALAVAWLAFPDDARRRWFFGPANLRLLCTDCHKAKTQEDRLLLRQAAISGPEWLKLEVLRRLGEAGQLVAARTGSPP